MLFSCACNFIKAWRVGADGGGARHLGDLKIFRGDILALACAGDALFAGVADGSIHAWHIPGGGQPEETPGRWEAVCARESAHNGRVTSVQSGGPAFLVTAGLDGMVRVWDTGALRGSGGGLTEPTSCRRMCSPGSAPAVSCVALSGSESVLLTGGDMGTITLWRLVMPPFRLLSSPVLSLPRRVLSRCPHPSSPLLSFVIVP